MIDQIKPRMLSKSAIVHNDAPTVLLPLQDKWLQRKLHDLIPVAGFVQAALRLSAPYPTGRTNTRHFSTNFLKRERLDKVMCQNRIATRGHLRIVETVERELIKSMIHISRPNISILDLPHAAVNGNRYDQLNNMHAREAFGEPNSEHRRSAGNHSLLEKDQASGPELVKAVRPTDPPPGVEVPIFLVWRAIQHRPIPGLWARLMS